MLAFVERVRTRWAKAKARKKVLAPKPVGERSESHRAIHEALVDWLSCDNVCRAALREGMSARALDAMRETLAGDTSEPQVRAMASLFLKRREVRQQVAQRMVLRGTTTRSQAMKMLKWLSEGPVYGGRA